MSNDKNKSKHPSTFELWRSLPQEVLVKLVDLQEILKASFDTKNNNTDSNK